MSTATVYSEDVTYSAWRTSNLSLSSVLSVTISDTTITTSTILVGLIYSSPNYVALQHPIKFDLTSIPSGSVISSATFTVKTSSASSGAFAGSAQLELVPFDWGVSVEIADYLSQTEYSAIAAVATYPLTGSIAADQTLSFTSGTPLINNLLPGSTSKFMLCNKAFRDGTAPTTQTDQSVKIYASNYVTSSYRPTLSITYTSGSSGTATNAVFFGSCF